MWAVGPPTPEWHFSCCVKCPPQILVWFLMAENYFNLRFFFPCLPLFPKIHIYNAWCLRKRKTKTIVCRHSCHQILLYSSVPTYSVQVTWNTIRLCQLESRFTKCSDDIPGKQYLSVHLETHHLSGRMLLEFIQANSSYQLFNIFKVIFLPMISTTLSILFSCRFKMTHGQIRVLLSF